MFAVKKVCIYLGSGKKKKKKKKKKKDRHKPGNSHIIGIKRLMCSHQFS